MSAAYHIAAIPEPYRILGLKLKPFSLGHYLLMRRFGCAFVSDEAEMATREDLILGVLICSMSYEQFLEFIEQKNFFKQIRKWGKKVGIFDLPSKARQFKEYLDRGTEQPKFWIEEDDDASSGGHWSQAVITTLTGQVGYSRKDVLNCPLTQAFSDFYKYAESMGMIRFMTPEEIAQTEAQESGVACGA